MRSRLGFAACLLLAGCECARPPVAPATSDLRASPGALDFGKVAVGASVTLSVDVQNLGAARGTAIASVTSGFDASPRALDLGAGEALRVTVTFAPQAAGPARGVLSLSGLPDIPLVAEGIPACAAAAPCQRVTFDLASRTCLASALPDATACSSACLENGQCRAGACVGTSVACDDRDPCTTDACAAGGACVHPPVECPAEGACRVGLCDPQLGCTAVEVQDGTPCGEDTCEVANLCLSGTCTQRPKPDAARECRYTQVASTGPGGTSCGLTVSGRVRCWGPSTYTSFPPPPGALTTLGLDYPFASVPPTLVPPLSAGVEAVGTSPLSFVVGATDGGIVLTGAQRGPDGGFGEPVSRLACESFYCTALLASGKALVWNTLTGAVEQEAQSVHDIGGGPTFVLRDGGLGRAAGGGALSPLALSGAATAVVDRRVPHVLFENGVVATLVLGPLTELVRFDGGISAISAYDTGSDAVVCGASPGRSVSCRDHTAKQVLGGQLTEDIAALSGACALTTGGRIWCSGGDTLPLALRPVVVATGVDAFALSTGSNLGNASLAVVEGRRLRGLGRPLAPFDGGAPVGEVVGELDGLSRVAVGDFEAFVLTDAGSVYRWSAQASLAPYPSPPDTLDIGFYVTQLVELTASHRLHWSFGQVAEHVVGFSRGAILFDDGGVTVPNGTSFGEPLPLPARAVGVSEGCALLETGAPTCFGARGTDGGIPLSTPAGLRPFARQVIGTSGAGCILYGSNGVQCWGDNFFGQLGVQGPARSTAVDLVIPEPIERLATSGLTVCAYTTSKKLLCWGDNSSGQLGFKRSDAFLPVLR